MKPISANRRRWMLPASGRRAALARTGPVDNIRPPASIRQLQYGSVDPRQAGHEHPRFSPAFFDRQFVRTSCSVPLHQRQASARNFLPGNCRDDNPAVIPSTAAYFRYAGSAQSFHAGDNSCVSGNFGDPETTATWCLGDQINLDAQSTKIEAYSGNSITPAP